MKYNLFAVVPGIVNVPKHELYFHWDHRHTPERPRSTCCIMHSGRVVFRSNSLEEVSRLLHECRDNNPKTMVGVRYES